MIEVDSIHEIITITILSSQSGEVLSLVCPCVEQIYLLFELARTSSEIFRPDNELLYQQF